MLATSEISAGHHNASFEIVNRLKRLLDDIKAVGLDVKGAYFNADSMFDVKNVRKLLWNRGLIPNIPENKRNRKGAKRGRKRYFNRDIYKHRATIERTFAWMISFVDY